MFLTPRPSTTVSAAFYAAWLRGIAVSGQAELVIPYPRRDELAGYKDLLAACGIRLITASDEETMRPLEEKPRLQDRMADAGVPITPFRLFRGLVDYEKLRTYGDLFPDHPGDLCVEPASGIYGTGFKILRERICERTQLSALTTLEISEAAFRATLAALAGAEQMMLMPRLPGPERSVDFACYEGRLLGTVTRRKSATSQTMCHDQWGEDLARLVTRSFRLSGILNLQTMEDLTGTQRLLEVNGRTSGGIGMTGLTSVNLPGLLLDALAGESPKIPARAQEDIVAGRREAFWIA